MHGCTVASDGYNLRCSVYKAFIICEKRKRYRYFLLKALHFICIREIGKKVLYVKFVYSFRIGIFALYGSESGSSLASKYGSGSVH